MNVHPSCHRVSDAAIAQVFDFCTQLVRLNLRDCHQITGKCLEMGGTAALRRLNIKHCSQVSIQETFFF